MASENIKLRKRNFTASDGYFYMMDEEQDSLLQKTDDGNTAFTYPLDTLLSNPVVSLEYDGVYFWSMENVAENDVIIRRWKIDNYICKLQQTIELSETPDDKYESQAFSIEHYHKYLTATVSGGASTLYLDGDTPVASGISVFVPNTYTICDEPGAIASGTGRFFVLQEAVDDYKMWFSNSSMDIAYMESTDGVSWTNYQVVIPKGSEGTHDINSVSPGTVLKDGSTYKMWYTGVQNGTPGRWTCILYCTSSDGINWTNFQLVKNNYNLGVFVVHPSNPSVIKDGSFYKMWHQATKITSAVISYCTSSDGISWSFSSIQIDEGGDSMSYNTSYNPCVIKDDDGLYRMWYVKIEYSGADIYNVHSPTGIRWYDSSRTLDCGSLDDYLVGLTHAMVVYYDSEYKMYGLGEYAGVPVFVKADGYEQAKGLHLGPNSNGDTEIVQVATVTSGIVYLKSPTTYAYGIGDEVNYFTNIWLFNDYDGTSSSTGALYKFDGWSGHYIKKYPGAAYKNIKAATFYKVDVFNDYPNVDALCYIKGTNTLFVNINEYEDGSLRYYGSMVMENIKLDEATVIDVYDMTIDRDNMYRLQLIPDGTNTKWSLYSYLLSPLDSFVTSISLSASPAIIAANGLSTSDILAVVKDQFMEPIIGRNITFSENGDGSLTGGTLKVTDSNGMAQTEYKAGTTAQEVKITAVVEQTN